MYCISCGKENPDTAVFCNACGDRMPVKMAVVPSGPKGKLKKMSVILFWFLNLITLGLYTPFWFLEMREGINSLRSKKKLGSVGVSLILLLDGMTLCAIPALLCVFGAFVEDADVINASDALVMGSIAMSLTEGLIILFLSFKIRGILDEHFNKHLGRSISFSRLWTLLFTIYYLQYKINRL